MVTSTTGPKHKTPRMAIDEVRRIFSYDKETGVLTWREPTTWVIPVGRVAGTVRCDGYVSVVVHKKRYLVHILAWAYVHGEWPSRTLDHKDGNPTNNKLGNIRLAGQSLNGANRRKRSTSFTGHKGVSRDNRCPNVFQARICVNGKQRHIGSFRTPQEANAAYGIAARKAFGDFAKW